jgi:hypothetical protein
LLPTFLLQISDKPQFSPSFVFWTRHIFFFFYFDALLALSCAKAGSSGVVHALASVLSSLDNASIAPSLLKAVIDLVVALAQGCDDNVKVRSLFLPSLIFFLLFFSFFAFLLAISAPLFFFPL